MGVVFPCTGRSPWWLLLVAAVTSCEHAAAPAAEPVPTDPAHARIVTDDIDRYWRAYDAGGRTGSAAAFQTRYLDSATSGLRDFMQLRAITAPALAQVALAYPRYLAALGTWWRTAAERDAVLATIRANYARLQVRYPEAVFPTLTIAVGRYSTAGTVGASGLLVGVEFFGVDAGAPVDELNAFARHNQKSWARDLPTLVAHEHVHALSLHAGATSRPGATLLARTLHEGVAEFVTELVAGRPTYLEFFRTWQSDEATYWTEFLADKDGTDISRWLYNQGLGGTRPGDLGYFIGYRIAQAYYQRATDKALALRTLIALRDPAAILAESGYAGQGPAIIP